MLSSLKAAPKFKTTLSGLLVICVVAAGIFILISTRAAEPELRGLHYTPEEVAIWRDRANSGPYRTAGDAGNNTPGDWTRITSNKNAFMSNPSAEIYEGYTGSGCVPRWAEIEPLSVGMKIRDASFYSLIKDDATVRAHVLSTLKTQIARPGVDFSNENKWCLEPRESRLLDINPGFAIAEWATRLLYSYDYIRPHLSATERQPIDDWFRNAGYYYRINSDESLVSGIYGTEENFLAGVLSSNGKTIANQCDSMQVAPGVWKPTGLTHIDGNKICVLGNYYNNRRAHMTSFYAQVGILVDDSTMQSWSKRWVKEYLKYHIYPDSTVNELQRGHGKNAALGWAYSSQTLGKVMDIVDAYARTGDTSLYEFVTSDGEASTTGGPKSFKTPAEFFVNTSEGNLLIYNWNTSKSVENLIGGVWYPENYYAYEVWLAQYNIYWKDPVITTAYKDPGPKNKQGTTANRELDYSWMGAGKAYPAKLFMFGQMEGKVWPYSGSTDPDPSDTTAPSVSLTSPADGSTVSGTVPITADASDDTGVSKVEFYRGTTLLGADTSSPYSYSWDTTTTANGSHSLTAKATDAAGNSKTSTAVSVTVDNGTSDGSHTSTTAWQSFALDAPQTAGFRFEFDAIPNASNMDGVTGLAPVTATSYDDLAVIARFNSSGMIDVRSGDTYAADATLAYTAGTSYHFQMDIDITSRTYSVTVTPSGQAPVTIATDYPFRSSLANVTELNYWSLKNEQGSHTVSNVSVATTPEPAPTPGDINQDGKVDVFDLSIMLDNWETSDPGSDLNNDGTVNVFDLSILLDNWGS